MIMRSNNNNIMTQNNIGGGGVMGISASNNFYSRPGMMNATMQDNRGINLFSRLTGN